VKKHFYFTCPNFHWRHTLEEREKHVVSSINDVTCGQCKGLILNVIRDQDWSKLDEVMTTVIQRVATQTLEQK
jgi:hypothetical protein